MGRPDLADRAISVVLEHIASPRPEEDLSNEFERAQPRILGALLDGVAHGQRALSQVRLNEYPRMADFAKFATACEGAYWSPGRSLPRTRQIAPTLSTRWSRWIPLQAP